MSRVTRFFLAAAFLAGASVPAAALDGNADAGKKVFAKCQVCHTIGDTKRTIGPNLNDVIGRTAGTQAEFLAKGAGGYSKAMIAAGKAGQVWTPEEIAIYVADPKKKIPGNKMIFPGLKNPQDAADVVAYVATFSKTQ
ncbi:cytochrome c [Rhodoligotrophos appendicifer]|uniref:c-type cytochrome n=1 Tax=Rhodoligotrophos appendicifer TaxID=987056 RepID=UPI001186B1AE|nr:c-type cytochrome [Rhodoligotrophos appendicifer]